MTAYLARILPAVLDDAARKRRNVIVRPRGGSGVTFIQLDDLNADKLTRVAPAVSLTLETSPGNFQAWAALPEIADKDFVIPEAASGRATAACSFPHWCNS